jgi:hypothetical protein
MASTGERTTPWYVSSMAAVSPNRMVKNDQRTFGRWDPSVWNKCQRAVTVAADMELGVRAVASELSWAVSEPRGK